MNDARGSEYRVEVENSFCIALKLWYREKSSAATVGHEMSKLEEIKSLVKQKDTCVLATAADNHPHCSLMAYVTDDDCREIYMVTSGQSKKYQNMVDNPSVSLLIDTREDHYGSRRPQAKALTVAGLYRRLEDEDKIKKVRSTLLSRHPHIKTFFEQPDAELICIEISSFLLLDGLTDAYFETV